MNILGWGILAACAASSQEEVSRWIEQLGADQIEEREEASRQLQRIGLPAVAPIERALAAERDPELRGRLAHLAQVIPKKAELAKVFGEARRVTTLSSGRPLADVVAEMGKALGETVEMEGFDGRETVALDLRNATLWEALDELAKAGNLHYRYDTGKLVLRKGARPRFPATYFEQFRVAVVAATGIERRRPGVNESAGMIVLEIRYQRNMRPSVDSLNDLFHGTEVVGAAGKPALVPRPSWDGEVDSLRRPFALQKVLLVGDKGAGPFSVKGRVTIPFASESRDVSLAVAGEGRELRDGLFTLRVSEFSPSAVSTRLTVEAEAADRSMPDAVSRLNQREVFIVDAAGNKHPVRWMGSRLGQKSSWDFQGGPEIHRPEKVVFRWVREFHRVEIPFQFEGIAVPDR